MHFIINIANNDLNILDQIRITTIRLLKSNNKSLTFKRFAFILGTLKLCLPLENVSIRKNHSIRRYFRKRICV